MCSQLKRVVIGITCLVLPVACTTVPNNASNLTEVARPSVEIDPQVMIDNAHALMENQKYNRARDSFAKILDVVPGNETAQAGLANAARLAGQHAEALKHYQQLESHPSYRKEALEGQGLVLVEMQQWVEAESILLSTLELDKNSWRTWNALGQVRDQQQRWVEAEVAYFNAISLRPLAASLYNNLGVSYLCQLRFDEAIDQFDRSLALKGGVETVEGNRVVALAMKGDYDAAMAGIPSSELQHGLNNLGFVAMLNGDTAQARRFLGKAEEESPRFYQKAAENLKMLN